MFVTSQNSEKAEQELETRGQTIAPPIDPHHPISYEWTILDLAYSVIQEETLKARKREKKKEQGERQEKEVKDLKGRRGHSV